MKFLFLACSVCFGDPSSLMSHGARMGVIFLLGVVFIVLFGIGWTAFTWIKRESELEMRNAETSGR